jgi:hypothetical protein
MDALNRKPLYTFGEPNEQVSSPVLVLGAARGGTSMVAGVLSKLGVFLGPEADSPVFESHKLSEILLGKSDKKAKDVVAELNAEHRVWAWKRPAAIYELSRTMKRMQPALVIMVFRDPIATATRRSMAVSDLQVKNIGMLSEHFQMVLNEYNEMLALASGLKVPFAMVSYDTAVRVPENFVSDLVEFLSIDATSQQVSAAVEFIKPSPPEYLLATRATSYVGVLDSVNSKLIRGWAKAKDSDSPVEIEVISDGKSIGRYMANEARKDLTEKSIGNHAFRINLETPLPSGSEVRVRVVGDDLDLLNSPMKIEN